MCNIIHTKDNKRMLQLYHKGIPYYKDKKLVPLLPEEYQQVEYLESTGTQWIDTRVKYIAYSELICDYMMLSEKYYQMFFGCTNYSDWSPLGIGNYYNTNEVYRYREMITSDIGIPYERKTISYGGRENSSEIYICWTKGPLGTQNYQKAIMRIWGARLIHKGILLFNLIPCYRKSDKVAGMYDLVSGDFFNNQGTGEFILGPDKTTLVPVIDNKALVQIYHKNKKVR